MQHVFCLDDFWEKALRAVNSSSSCIRLDLIQFKVLHRIHYSKARRAKLDPGRSDEGGNRCLQTSQTPCDLTHMFWWHPKLLFLIIILLFLIYLCVYLFTWLLYLLGWGVVVRDVRDHTKMKVTSVMLYLHYLLTTRSLKLQGKTCVFCLIISCKCVCKGEISIKFLLLLHNGTNLYAGLLRRLTKLWIWMCYFYKVCLREQEKLQITYNSAENTRSLRCTTCVRGRSTGSEAAKCCCYGQKCMETVMNHHNASVLSPLQPRRFCFQAYKCSKLI